MREVLTISVPSELKTLVKKKSKKLGFSSVSGYIQFLIKQDDDDLISEEELLQAAKEAEEEYKKGTIIRANSIKDLL